MMFKDQMHNSENNGISYDKNDKLSLSKMSNNNMPINRKAKERKKFMSKVDEQYAPHDAIWDAPSL